MLIVATTVVGQIFNPVKWDYKTIDKGNGQFDLEFHATIDDGWHLYSQHIAEDGPIPTSFNFEKNSSVKFVGDIKEDEGHTHDDPMFGMVVKWFETKAVFVQTVEFTGASTTVSGELEFMVCNDAQCLPPEYLDFSFEVTNAAGASKKESIEPNVAEKAESKDAEKIEAMQPSLAGDIHAPVAENNKPEILTPVTWTHRLEKHGEGDYSLVATATIDAHWHVYSLFLPEGDGPIKTEFNLLSESGVETVGEVTEHGELLDAYDENFQMDLLYFENKMEVRQRVKVDESAISEIEAEVYFMTCDDKRCLVPESIEMIYKLSEAVETAFVEKPSATATKVSTEDHDESNEKEATNSESPEADRSLFAIFLLSFIGGFAALLTPCVFPMIPMTVSFFTKQSKSKSEGIRNAIIYGASIIGIYTLIGLIVTKAFGPDALNALSTDPIFNIFFFLLLVIFAVSFLGAFEITLPSSWVNKADRASDKGGLIGIFFMALVLGLVSFSCTGPIIGTLLVDAAVHGGVQGPLIGMFGFSLALALPFTLFAAFPGWLNSLPKSGGWLNSVKVVLGFLELALAFKFLSTADMVMQWHLLPREIFLAIWITIFLMLTFYLLGLFRMPHDSPLEKITVGRTMLAIVSLFFVVYMLPGMWGAPLKLISGFPPAKFYSEAPNGVGFEGGSGYVASAENIPEGADPAHCPHNLNCFHDYELGLAYAKSVNKPVLIDFTGWGCVNCRKMEEQVWSDPAVLERLRNDYVLISLYVDEKTKLPKEEQYVSETTGKKVKTIGNKWADFQAKRYGTNSQPYYVIINHDEKQLNESAAYDPDIAKYLDWLDRGIKSFEH